ncbi:glycosyltransferase family 4 protein [Methyloglobulus sp.]|uniref:glycosyltransferase family 4 protein n=1 Tax=Methyloglobulus sp. TaxID=2518622 RepID=UPI00398A485D
MRIALISDAWHPQVNGVVTTLTNTVATLKTLGHEVGLITPDRFKAYPWPGYPDVGLSFLCGPRLRPIIKAFKPDAIHLVTEGPIGYAARRYCREFGYRYSSSYLSQFPEYFKLRIGFPVLISEAYLRWFHSESDRVMVATASLEKEMHQKGYLRLARWSRGVDTELFRPRTKDFIKDQRPIFMFTGRVAIEKNIEAFLKLDLPGTKYVIGDGSNRDLLAKKYPAVRFTGYQQGENLARFMAAADVFVFPSLTDTFGVVLLEALASGVPVAGYPVQSCKDVITDEQVGILSVDLQYAAMTALSLNPQTCRRYALEYTWEKCTQQFVDNLVPMV